MDNAKSTLLRAGGKDQLVTDFTSLCEATTLDGLPKYAERPTMEGLAKIITAQGGGPNKDMALFELSHLVYAVAERLGPDSLTDFFLNPEKATPNTYRQAMGEMGNADCISLSYDAKTFDIRFGRIPVLVALYEFLSSMDDFAYFQVITDLFSELVGQPISDKSLRACTNGLASYLRKYRIAYLTTAQADGKFVQLYKFLQENSDESSIIIDDDSVLDFWALHNKGKDYKGYRTVFDLFCDFTKAFDEAERMKASSHASRLGVDMEQGEIDVAVEDIESAGLDEWVSPFEIFDQENFADVRFFKKKTERGPVENLMSYGPDALRLPLAFIRYEIFGQVQSGITNDLQVGRGKASVEKRISCEDVQSYEERLSQCEDIKAHVKELQASSLHVLSDDNVVTFPGAAVDAAKKSFSKMNRKGFDGSASENKEIFQQAADSLIRMERQLDRYMDGLRQKGAVAKFPQDVEAFKIQFSHLYEEALS